VGHPLPRTRRIASPSFDRSVGADVLALGLAGLAAPFLVPPNVGAGVMFVLLAAALATANRRRTVGAYEGDDALVVRGFLATTAVPWEVCASVEVVRDPWLPWLRTAAVRRDDGRRVPVTALRHRGVPTAEVLNLTRIVREHREARSREPWSD
jgi:hypothetical protein